MKVLGINHLGLAAKDPVKARWFFESVLGLSFLGEQLVKEQKTLTQMLGSQSAQLASGQNPRLEILIDDGSQTGPIGKFVESRGGGIHHLALSVEDIEEAIAHMKSHQVKMIDESPRNGAHNTSIAFVHPHSTGGLLIELVEQKRGPVD